MTRLKTLAAALLAVSILKSGAALAQPEAGNRTVEFPGAMQSVLEINFGGGNVVEYFEHLQQQTGIRNILIEGDDLADVSMPKVKLSRVLFADLVELPYFLAEVPDGHYLDVETVGSKKSIFVVDLRSLEDSQIRVDPEHRPISFDFEGGSLEEFIATVQQAAGTEKVLVRGDTGSFTMPPLKLEGVTLYGVLSALDGDERVSDGGERLRISVDDREGVYLVEVETEQSRFSPARDTKLRTVSWSLAAMRGPGRLSTEEMLTAIEAAVEVSGATDTTTIRFHDETSLLIVSARADAIQTIDGVLGELRRTSEESARQYQQIQQKHNRLADLEAQRRAVEQNIERLTLRLEEARKTNTPQADQQIMMLSGGLENSESQLNDITQEILRLRTELERTTQSP